MPISRSGYFKPFSFCVYRKISNLKHKYVEIMFSFRLLYLIIKVSVLLLFINYFLKLYAYTSYTKVEKSIQHLCNVNSACIKRGIQKN